MGLDHFDTMKNDKKLLEYFYEFLHFPILFYG